MFRCIVTVLLISTLFGAVFGSALNFDIDEVISRRNQNYNLNIDIEEGETMILTFKTNHFINSASCKRELFNTHLELSIQNGSNITAVFHGEKRYEGKWNCSFTRLVNAGNMGNIESISYCSVTITIIAGVVLTVSSSGSKYSVETNYLAIFYFKENQKVFAKCQTYSTNGAVSSPGPLMMKLCLNGSNVRNSGGICDIITETNELILPENRKESVLHCIYTSKFQQTYEARVVFRLEPVPEIFEVIANNNGTMRMMPGNDGMVFDGKVGEKKLYECRNKSKYGTIHWEFCRNINDNHCKLSQTSETTLDQDVTIKDRNQGTILKCVHTSNHSKFENKIVLYANKPPSVKIKGKRLDYNLTSDVYVVKGDVGDYLEINCHSEERDKPISLYWKNCTGRYCKSSESGEKQFQEITLVHTLKLEDNRRYLSCAFKNARNVEISTKIAYIVLPKTTKVSSPRKIFINARSSGATYVFEYGDRLTVVCSVFNYTFFSFLYEHNLKYYIKLESSDISKLKLKIEKEGATVTEFKNGDTLDFSCSDSKSNRTQLKITLYPKDEESFNVQVTSEADKSTYRGHHKMNFTSRTVEVNCASYQQNFNTPRLSHVFLSLNRSIDAESNLDMTAESLKGSTQPLWMWIAIGSGVFIVAVLVACIVMAFKKGKREEAMIQRASVDYEYFTNDTQPPNPPFPRGAKLEQTYLSPVDSQVSPYATSRPQDTETYALPYAPSNVEELYSKPLSKTSRINALYSQVVPKSLRGNQNSSKYVNSGVNDELHYAEIGHQNKNYANVGDKSKEKSIVEDNYAEIVNRNVDYANLNEQKMGGKLKDDSYTNVFTNDPYVNAKRDDYAEPSYCELSRKN